MVSSYREVKNLNCQCGGQSYSYPSATPSIIVRDLIGDVEWHSHGHLETQGRIQIGVMFLVKNQIWGSDKW